jgi:DTW domain-containing protein YfiP
MSEKKRLRKTLDPCEVCRLHKARCICSQIPVLDLKTRVSLIIHAKELKRTTNTGTLALHALKNSQMFVRGEDRERLDLTKLISNDYVTYLLYPSEDAVDIESLAITKPIHLIVPDGNWRQAGKVHLRHLELRDVVRVKISQKNLGNHHLRKEHKSEGFSTLEAIALALLTIEGPAAGEPLLKLYRAKLEATLTGRPPTSGKIQSTHESSPQTAQVVFHPQSQVERSEPARQYPNR